MKKEVDGVNKEKSSHCERACEKLYWIYVITFKWMIATHGYWSIISAKTYRVSA